MKGSGRLNDKFRHIYFLKILSVQPLLLYTTGHKIVEPPEQADEEVMEEVLPTGIRISDSNKYEVKFRLKPICPSGPRVIGTCVTLRQAKAALKAAKAYGEEELSGIYTTPPKTNKEVPQEYIKTAQARAKAAAVAVAGIEAAEMVAEASNNPGPKDAFGNVRYPYDHSAPTDDTVKWHKKPGGNQFTKCFDLVYGVGNNGKEGSRAYGVAVKVRKPVGTIVTVKEIKRRLVLNYNNGKESTLDYYSGGNLPDMTAEEAKKSAFECGVAEQARTSEWKRCTMPFKTDNKCAVTHEERVRLMRHLNDILVQRLISEISNPGPYDPESTHPANLFNDEKLGDRNACGPTFADAFPPGSSKGKTAGTHSTPLSLDNCEIATFNLAWAKEKLGRTSWWEPLLEEEKNWLQAMDGLLCIMPTSMFDHSMKPRFLKVEKRKYEKKFGYAITSAGEALYFGRYHSDRGDHNNVSKPDGGVHYLTFFRACDLKRWSRQTNADSLKGCERIGKFYMPMPIWLAYRVDFNDHYTSNWATFTKVIENFNYCEQVVTDLNSKDAVVGDFGGFVFEGGKTFDPSKTRGGL